MILLQANNSLVWTKLLEGEQEIVANRPFGRVHIVLMGVRSPARLPLRQLVRFPMRWQWLWCRDGDCDDKVGWWVMPSRRRDGCLIGTIHVGYACINFELRLHMM